MRSEKVRKTLDRLAYVSLFLDICIAVVTLYSVLGVQGSSNLLLPISYLLSAVVVLSVALFAVLLALRLKENQARNVPNQAAFPVCSDLKSRSTALL